MREWSGKRYWLVGASEGLGRALAHKLSRAGAEVIVSARSEDKLKEVVAELPGRARHVTVDIADSDSVAAAVAEVGEIDGVVFLAGLATLLKAQDWDTERVEQMFDVNLTGAARVIGRVIKPMVERDDGHIVMIGSLSAYRGSAGIDRLFCVEGGADGAGGIHPWRSAAHQRDGAAGQPGLHRHADADRQSAFQALHDVPRRGRAGGLRPDERGQLSQGVPIPVQPAFPLVPVPAHGALRGDLLPPVA
jgi:NAD(P)-dependent dehydrogenase (short-subunit alcohol dehydrogenase family)